MGLFRRKKNQIDPDQIYDLDDVVWRGVDQMQRLDRLADAADRAAEHHHDNPDQPPYYPPRHPASLMDEVLASAAPNDWAPQDEDRPGLSQLDDEAEDIDITMSADLAEDSSSGVVTSPDDAADLSVADDQDNRTEESADEVSMDMISDAVEAVVSSDAVAASVRAEAMAHDHSAPKADASIMPGLDVKNAVEQVVREELTGWLQTNMSRIIAESMPPRDEPVKDPSTSRAKKQSSSVKPKVKTRAKSKRSSDKAPDPDKIIPLKGRDSSS